MKDRIIKAVEILQSILHDERNMLDNDLLKEKYQNIQKAMKKCEFEKTFWQRKCKLYVPNRMEQHYMELNEELKKAGLYFEKQSKM